MNRDRDVRQMERVLWILWLLAIGITAALGVLIMSGAILAATIAAPALAFPHDLAPLLALASVLILLLVGPAGDRTADRLFRFVLVSLAWFAVQVALCLPGVSRDRVAEAFDALKRTCAKRQVPAAPVSSDD